MRSPLFNAVMIWGAIHAGLLILNSYADQSGA